MKNKALLVYFLVTGLAVAICVGGYVQAQQGPANGASGGIAGPTGPTGPTGPVGGGTPFSFSLSSAQLRTLFSSPVTVPALVAPGAGKLLEITQNTVIYTFGTHQYLCATSEHGYFSYVNDPGPITPIFDFSATRSIFQDSGFPQFNALPGFDVNSAINYTAGCDFDQGPIATTTLASGGLGYAVGDTGLIDPVESAAYVVNSVAAITGAVLTYSITNPGNGYTVSNGNTTVTGGGQPGIGTGLTLNITGISTGDGTATVTGFYKIVTIP